MFEEDVPTNLEGEMYIHSNKKEFNGGAPNFNTLDEPVKDTIIRDIREVCCKFRYVLYPKEKHALLKNWDLWGPLILCTFLATFLQISSSDDEGPEFAHIFIILWIGAAIVTLNSKLLGGKISFFQSVCVLGYCLTPIAISAIICRVILLYSKLKLLFYLRLITTMIGFMWATYASFIFLQDSHPPNRKPLAVYPISLFFFMVSWLVMARS